MLTQERLKKVLNYDPETGIFTWRKRLSPSVRVGAVAGRVSNKGYIQIGIDLKRITAHRLAWLYVHGQFPPNFIDHINHKKTDNRISNLRLVTNSINAKNLPRRKDNTSGFTGVYWLASSGKWMSLIDADGRRVYLGIFKKIEDAANARKEAEEKYGFHKNHGASNG